MLNNIWQWFKNDYEQKNEKKAKARKARYEKITWTMHQLTETRTNYFKGNLKCGIKKKIDRNSFSTYQGLKLQLI